MTIIRRVAHFPSLGKEPEYRKLLEGRVASITSSGFTPLFMSRLLPDGGPELALYIRFDDMDALEKFRAADRADPDFINAVQEINTLSRRGFTVALFAPILQTVLEEFVKARQADGRPVGLTRQVLSPTGPTFIFTETYETLSEYESEYVTKSPPSLATAQQKIKGLLQSPVEQVMYEILS